MLFNSLDFLAFLALVLGLYFSTPHRYRWAVLLGASYYFYGCWKVEYLLLIAASTGVDYLAALQMEKASSKARRQTWLFVSIGSNLGILFGFKYLSFVNDSLRAAFNTVNIFYEVPSFDLLLPIGISYYTLQTLGYSIDVYRGERTAERHLGRFALYVSFFPQLLAGPIERAGKLLPQLGRPHAFTWSRAREGVLLIAWGFFKKLVIADRLAVYVDQVYGAPGAFGGPVLLIASYLFAYQLYCDFSGYTDIAIGTARIMGIDLSENFRRPFAAKSFRDFWQRWHITLTHWMTRYVYLPLARRAASRAGRYAAVMMVFFLIGLWHGAAWHFVALGIYLALVVMSQMLWQDATKRLAGRLWQPARARVYQAGFGLFQSRALRTTLRTVAVFNVIVIGAFWFRIDSLQDAALYIQHLFDPESYSLTAFWAARRLPGFDFYQMGVALLSIALLEVVQWLHAGRSVFDRMAAQPAYIRWLIYTVLVLGTLMLGTFERQPFIYFQF